MSMQTPPDSELVPRLRSDPKALDAFYRRHVDRVTRFAARRCQNPEDLADVVADTFVEALLSADRFDPRRGEPVAWLLGIAAHRVSGTYRRDRRDRALGAALSGRELLDEDDYERLSRRIDAERLAPAIALALDAMPPGERDVLELVDLDGLAPVEAARALRILPAAARMRLARARRRLRSELGPIHLPDDHPPVATLNPITREPRP
jgi:RNA polymerase sigma-70 factor (ECF subfamily)